MNYRHHFHAGNFADVLKHVVLGALLRALQSKPKGLLYLDTHAGRGFYDLTVAATGDRLERQPEWPDGIGRLMDRTDLPEAVAYYVAAVKEGLPKASPGLRFYPGSPWFAQQLLRTQDRAVFAELQPGEYGELYRRFDGVPGTRTAFQDGYEAVRAHLPPAERRALVLIDPPYEAGNELASVVTALEEGLARLPGGTFAVWYPLTARARASSLLPRVERLKLPPSWVVELTVAGEDSTSPRMPGCGLLVVNPPWQLDREVAPAVRWLGGVLAQAPGGRGELRWIVPER